MVILNQDKLNKKYYLKMKLSNKFQIKKKFKKLGYKF